MHFQAHIPLQPTSAEKVTFEIPFGRSAFKSKKLQQKVDNMITIINSLAPKRIRAVAQMSPNHEGSATVIADKTTDSTFTIPKNVKQRPFLQRLYAGPSGYSISSVNVAGKYTTDSPASAMFDHLGHLQSGVLSATSYFSSVAGLSAISGGTMEPYGVIAGKIKKSFNDYMKTASTVTLGKFGISPAVIDEISKTKFEEIIKAKAQDLADFDYNGMLGPKDKESLMISNLRKDITGVKPTDSSGQPLLNEKGEQYKSWKKVYHPVMEFISTWVDSVKYDMAAYLKTLTIKEQLKIYRAYRLIEPGYMMKGPLGDRTTPAMTLSKTWFSMETDEYSNPYIMYMRVDEDRG